MYPISIIGALALIQDTYDYLSITFDGLRKTHLVPIVLRGGRNMVMIKGGTWLDSSSTEHAIWTYDSTKNLAIHRDGTGRVNRWKWIAVNRADMSEFFGTLRLSADHMLTEKEAILLFAHQRCCVPSGTVTVTLRDGSDVSIDIDALF